MQTLNYRICKGKVFHIRNQPVKRSFSNRYWFADIDLESCREQKSVRLDPAGFLRIRSADHLGSSDKSLYENIKIFAESHSLNTDVKMRMLTVPSLFGFVFNPVSFFTGADRTDGRLLWVLAEVHNYNGGRRIYTFEPHVNGNRNESDFISKDFFVSPFYKKEGSYQFIFQMDDDYTDIKINLHSDDGEIMFRAGFRGTNIQGSSLNLFRGFMHSPFLQIVIPLYTIYQAVRLMILKLPVFSPDESDKNKEA